MFPHESEPCEGVWDQFPRHAGAFLGLPTLLNLTSGLVGKRHIKIGHLVLGAPLAVLNAGGEPETHKRGEGTWKVRYPSP